MSNTVETFYGVNDEAVKQAILWQYDEATALQSLINQKYAWLRNTNDLFWCWFLFYYFYLEEADDDGVTIWAILLNIGISSSLPPNTDEVWGFSDDDVNFDNGVFGSVEEQVVHLPVQYARLALMLRYFQLTTSGTVPQINAFWKYLLRGTPDKTIIVIDNHDMTITYRLNFTPDVYLRFIFDNMDLLPRPAGVEVNWESLFDDYWGFGDDDFNFDNGILFEGNTP